MTVRAGAGTMEIVSTAALTRVDYLDALAAALVGPRRTKRDLMQEAHDHLDDATAAYVRAGYDEPDAAAMAVADFGSVDEVAPAFQSTLAVASSRRTALLLFAAIAIQPLVWDGPLSRSEVIEPNAFYAALDVGVEVVGLIALALSATLVIACGIGSRWVRSGRALARLTGVVTITAAVSIKLTGIAMTVAADDIGLQQWLMVLAFLFVPFSVAATSARRTLATA